MGGNLILTNKIQNNLTPAYMKDPLPLSKNNRYGTRSEHVLQEFKCNTVSYRGSFYPDSVKCWNRIGRLYRNSPNLKSFKAKLVASYSPTPKSIFGIFNPIGVQRLFQLRVGLSPLLEHKNNHNFLEKLEASDMKPLQCTNAMFDVVSFTVSRNDVICL